LPNHNIKTLRLNHISSQLNSVHTLTPYRCAIVFLIPPSTLTSPRCTI